MLRGVAAPHPAIVSREPLQSQVRPGDPPPARQGSHSRRALLTASVLRPRVGLDSVPARARPVGEFDLATQVSRYLDDFHGRAPSRALYIVFIGGNDLRDALEVAPDFPTSFSILLDAVSTIEESIRRLAAEGAQTFLVANAPDLSLVPAVRLQGPLAQEAAKALSEFFNGNLEVMLQTLQADPDLALLTLKRLDVFAFLTAVVQHPESFGLDDAVNPCITPGVLPNAICSHPDRFLFWDGIHPTRTGHRLLAIEA